MSGFTLDTGALIALERESQTMRRWLAVARKKNFPITLPSVVVGEFWRGRPRGPVCTFVNKLDADGRIEPLTTELAKLAGASLRLVGSGPSLADAIVVASAASRGDIVLTSDIDDIMQLIGVFPMARFKRV